MKERLLNVIEKTRSWKLIIHNNPDPDAIASSYAFSYLLSKLGKRAAIYYSGIIGRAENKEMVKRLGIPLKNIDSLKLKEGMNIAMFDCQPGGGNQPLGKNIIPKIVIDHHFFRNDTKKALFYDVRENIGSSSTIVAQYIKDFGTELNNKVATALYYGIKTDTMNFTRDFTKTDLDILNFIIEKVSLKVFDAAGNLDKYPVENKNLKLETENLTSTYFAEPLDRGTFHYRAVITGTLKLSDNYTVEYDFNATDPETIYTDEITAKVGNAEVEKFWGIR